MNYFKGVLSAVAALTLVAFGPPVVIGIRAIAREKATGIAVLTGGLSEALKSPAFWLSVVVLFGLFWLTGHLRSKFLRVILFWIPAITISAIGGLTLVLILSLVFHTHHA